MAKNKEQSAQTIELKKTKTGEVRVMDILHATKTLIQLEKMKMGKTFTLPDGWIFNGVDIVKV